MGQAEGPSGGWMPARLKRLLLRLFKVDERPEPPPGSPESLRVFRASPRFFGYSLFKWGVGQTLALLGLVGSAIGLRFDEFIAEHAAGAALWFGFLAPLTPFLIVPFVLQLVTSFFVLRLGYEMRWYMLNDRALRIRYGIYSVREQTMTILNVQNMAVKRGPLQRLFGIADLEIRTASGAGDDDDEESLSRGLLQGLDNAEELRNVLLASLQQSRDAGLGDPDDRLAAAALPAALPETGAPSGAEDGSVLAAARELLAESRALRRTVTRSEG